MMRTSLFTARNVELAACRAILASALHAVIVYMVRQSILITPYTHIIRFMHSEDNS